MGNTSSTERALCLTILFPYLPKCHFCGLIGSHFQIPYSGGWLVSTGKVGIGHTLDLSKMLQFWISDLIKYQWCQQWYKIQASHILKVRNSEFYIDSKKEPRKKTQGNRTKNQTPKLTKALLIREFFSYFEFYSTFLFFFSSLPYSRHQFQLLLSLSFVISLLQTTIISNSGFIVNHMVTNM